MSSKWDLQKGDKKNSVIATHSKTGCMFDFRINSKGKLRHVVLKFKDGWVIKVPTYIKDEITTVLQRSA